MSYGLVMDKERLKEFLETQDLSVLEKPIKFERNQGFTSYQCCLGGCMCLSSWGITAFFCPIATFCPGTLYKHFGLELHKDSVKLDTATNDCCCHVAVSQKTVPMEKIQDVELQENWMQTMFGLKQLNVQTAGQGGIGAEIMAAFLDNPEESRDAIQLGVRLYRARMDAQRMAPPQQATVQRQDPSSTLSSRLDALEKLVERGVLTADEAGSVKVKVLAAEHNCLTRLKEAADLYDQRRLSQEDFALLKGLLLKQCAEGK